ncbi:MAG: division/cell wall cluster transcriptional repressor MraZ [Spirochaetales bacterium]|nr:division/cell wall cluster transcriptional repressor MraZ [Spirochaetales bacterium]
MLSGEFVNNIDEKGRIMIPVKLRAAIDGDSLILTRGVDQCLWLFPVSEWQKVSQQIMSATSILQARARMIQRRIIAPAQETEIDRSGRINIAPVLRSFAQLKKECVILGINNYIEIWDEEVYQKYWEENEADFQKAAEELGKIVSV